MVISGRDQARTGAVAREIGGTGIVCDFENVSDVRDLADTLLETQPRIDVLANNAGGMYNSRELTVEGPAPRRTQGSLFATIIPAESVSGVRETGSRPAGALSRSTMTTEPRIGGGRRPPAEGLLLLVAVAATVGRAFLFLSMR